MVPRGGLRFPTLLALKYIANFRQSLRMFTSTVTQAGKLTHFLFHGGL